MKREKAKEFREKLNLLLQEYSDVVFKEVAKVYDDLADLVEQLYK